MAAASPIVAGVRPGRERRAALDEFRNPTTTKRFAPFVPLLASKLRNNTGVPFWG